MTGNFSSGSTIYDIAEKANVSISTVSRVINGSDSVSKKTKKKIQKIIEQMNYIPNSVARSLVQKKTKTIGLIVSDVTNHFFNNVIDGIDNVLSIQGFTILWMRIWH